MVEYNLVVLWTDYRAALIHLRDVVHLVCMVDGAAHQTQGGHAAARGLDLGKNQERDDDRHQRIGEGHGSRQAQPHRRGQDQNAEQVEDHLLAPDIGSEQLLHRQIVRPAVLQRLPHPLVTLSRQVKGLDDAHALKLLQYRLHQPGLVPLTLGGDLGGLLLHPGEEGQIHQHSRQGQQTDPPVPEQDAQQHDGRIDQAAQDTNQYHRAGALHLVQNGGGDAGELSQTLVVEIAHGDPLEFVADGDTLIRHHEVAGVGLLELAEAVEDRPAQNAGQQKPQRLPCRGGVCGAAHQGQHHHIDGRDLEHVEHRVKEA